MKNLSKLILSLLFVTSSISYCQVNNSIDLKTSSSIESNSIFVGSATIKDSNATIFKNQNFNTFYLIKEIKSTATKTFYSLDELDDKNGKYIIKTIYDSDKSIISIHISSFDSSKLKSKIINSTTLANKIKGCNRYNYSIEGCWNAFINWLSE